MKLLLDTHVFFRDNLFFGIPKKFVNSSASLRLCVKQIHISTLQHLDSEKRDFEKYKVVGASCSLHIKCGQNDKVWAK